MSFIPVTLVSLSGIEEHVTDPTRVQQPGHGQRVQGQTQPKRRPSEGRRGREAGDPRVAKPIPPNARRPEGQTKVGHPTSSSTADVLDRPRSTTWSRLRVRGRATARRTTRTVMRRQFTLFIIDVVDPPIVIQSPTTAIQQVVISNLVDIKGRWLQDVRDLLEAVGGTEFARPAACDLPSGSMNT